MCSWYISFMFSLVIWWWGDSIFNRNWNNVFQFITWYYCDAEVGAILRRRSCCRPIWIRLQFGCQIEIIMTAFRSICSWKYNLTQICVGCWMPCMYTTIKSNALIMFLQVIKYNLLDEKWSCGDFWFPSHFYYAEYNPRWTWFIFCSQSFPRPFG